MTAFTITIVLSAGTHAVRAQPPPAGPPAGARAATLDAFVGGWACNGAFANGRSLAADVTFERELGGTWLRMGHVDRAPGQYRALGMWRTEADGRVTAWLFDAHGPVRRFAAAAWDGATLLLERDSTLAPATRPDRFRYRVADRGHFRMEYEVRRTPGGGWAPIDFIECERVAG